MTDLSDDFLAASLPRDLTRFEGREVVRSAIEIPGAAGGLRDAMQFDPIELHHGQELHLVMKVEVIKVRFDPIKDTDALTRVQVLKPLDGQTAFIEESIVMGHLAEQADRIRVRKEEAAGVYRLTGPDPSDEDDPFGTHPDEDDADLEARREAERDAILDGDDDDL